MKTMRVAGLVLACCLAVSARAGATDFKLGGYDVSLNTSGSGLQLWTSNLLGEADKTFSLTDVGQTYETALFRLGTSEVSLDGDDLVPIPITVALSFVAPPPGFSGATGGLTGAAWFIVNFGYVVWNSPATIAAWRAGGGLGEALFFVPLLLFPIGVIAGVQGAAAGWGSYIVGESARYYFEHGASWGPQGPKRIVSRILENTDKKSVLQRLKQEIKKKISLNRYAKK